MTLNIFGWKIRVLKKHTIVDEATRGLFDPTIPAILVHSELVGDEFMHTVIHETIHSIIYRTGLDQAKIPIEIEEVLCENIATCLIENFAIKPKN